MIGQQAHIPQYPEKCSYMIVRELPGPRPDQAGTLRACIFDVDGVLLASPHERAWREALQGFADPDRFTTSMYQAHVAGKPRLSGARAALVALGVPSAERQAVAYAERKRKAAELHADPVHCFVAEDAPVGIEAARAGNMTGLGVARYNDEAWLEAAGANLVVTSLDEVAVDQLADGRLCRRLT
jgi:beta-phosphoglucomutase-like phosphatase (HAD superfamily)